MEKFIAKHEFFNDLKNQNSEMFEELKKRLELKACVICEGGFHNDPKHCKLLRKYNNETSIDKNEKIIFKTLLSK